MRVFVLVLVSLYAQAQWVSGGTQWLHYCHTFNLDYDTANDDRDVSCTRIYFSPFLKVGDQFHLFFRPAVIGSYSNLDRVSDVMPSYLGNSQTTLTVAEAYAYVSDQKFSLKAGYQAIEWNDGVILSKREWSQEPITHLAARGIFTSDDISFELLASERPSDLRVLDGHTHITLLGGRLVFPESWGNVFFIETDFGKYEHPNSVYTGGHRIQNAGYYGEARYGSWDHKISAIYQKHRTHMVSGVAADPIEGNMYDLEFGVTADPQPARVSLRLLHASGNFVPIFEDDYSLGLSGLVTTRSNIEQIRGKIQIHFSDVHVLTSELMTTKEFTSSGFIRQTASSSSGEPIGSELDFLHRWKPSEAMDVYFGVWAFFPPPLRVRDSARGFMGRVVHRF